MKPPLLAPMSQTTSPGRMCRLIMSNSAFWSRNLAFSARTLNRTLSVVNQAWKTDTDQPSASERFGPPHTCRRFRIAIKIEANPSKRVSPGPSTLSLRSGYAGHAAPARSGVAAPRVAREGEAWWGKKDSNLRSHKTADLQSAPFATRDTPPLNPIASPPAGMATDMAMDDVKTGRRWRTPGRAVYGGIAMAKSTNGRRLIRAARGSNCHNAEPVTQACHGRS